MKMFFRDLLLSFVIGFALPWMIIITFQRNESRRIPKDSADMEPSVHIRLSDDTVMQLPLNTYLVNVVLAEMPAYFEEEALKAQAIAARTYTCKVMQEKHSDGILCTDSTCCQAYIAEEDFRNRGGSDADIEKIRAAVLSTDGLVLTFQGELIEAAYFSCSGGSTEDSVDVWGGEYPYLKAADSPGEESAPVYSERKEYTREMLEEAFAAPMPEKTECWIADIELTAGGGVASACIGGRRWSGTEIRSKLGLRSAKFRVTAKTDSIEILTYGNGHRVGMSQYGAEAMALSGKSYSEILSHYYPGTELCLVAETAEYKRNS